MKQKTLDKYINTTHGVLTILELDHEEYDKIKQIELILKNIIQKIIAYLVVLYVIV